MKVTLDCNDYQALTCAQLIAELKKPGKCIVSVAFSEVTVAVEKADLIKTIMQAPKDQVLFKAMRAGSGDVYLISADY